MKIAAVVYELKVSVSQQSMYIKSVRTQKPEKKRDTLEW